MNLRIVGVIAVLAIALGDPAAVRAQGGVVGSIVGSVFDQTGSPMKGVKITATSDTQIGGAKVGYSDDDGNFRFPGLQPGKFDVVAAAPKLKTMRFRDIVVGVSAAAEVTIVMEVETQVEEIKVVERAPAVSTTRANVKTTYDEEFVDALPLDSRYQIESHVALNTAGITQPLDQGARVMRIRGGNNQQNALMIEGFTVTRQEIAPKSLAALEVNTAGYGAEYAHIPGGVVNMVSKSGSNKYELDVSGFIQHPSMSFFRDASDTASATTLNTYFNPAFSGPIIKDRLWFYVNTELRYDVTEREQDITGVLPPTPDRVNLNPRVTAKLTWQVTPRNKIQSFTNFNREWATNDAPVLDYDADAQRQRQEVAFFTGVTWESLLTDNLFFKTQVGHGRGQFGTRPMRCINSPVECDTVAQLRNTVPRSLRFGNYHEHTQDDESTIEVVSSLEWYGRHKVFGDHDLKVTSRVLSKIQESRIATPGDAIVEYSGATPSRQTEFYTNDPRVEDARYGWFISGTRGLLTVHSLADSMRLTRYLTVSPSVALTTSSATNAGESTSRFDQKSVSPSISVAWDATHDGRTALRASFSQYVDTDAIRLAAFAFGSRVQRQCGWDDGSQAFTRSCAYSGGRNNRTFGLPCGPSGLDGEGNDCKETLKLPKTWEYTAGAEREIVPGVGLGADVVYRLYTGQYERRETNRVWQPSGYALAPIGATRNGRDETITDLGTIGRRRYLGVTAALHKREGKLKTSGSYTWAKLEGNTGLSDENSQLGENPGRDLFLWGPLDDEARHTVKVSSVYRLTEWLSGGVIYRYQSGRPYNRWFRNDVLNGFNDLRGARAINPGGNVNDPSDDRELRLPDLQQVNLQLRVNLRPLTGVNFEGWVDVLNILALRTTTSVFQEDNASFGLQRSRMAPLSTRVGFRFRY